MSSKFSENGYLTPSTVHKIGRFLKFSLFCPQIMGLERDPSSGSPTFVKVTWRPAQTLEDGETLSRRHPATSWWSDVCVQTFLQLQVSSDTRHPPITASEWLHWPITVQAGKLLSDSADCWGPSLTSFKSEQTWTWSQCEHNSLILLTWS